MPGRHLEIGLAPGKEASPSAHFSLFEAAAPDLRLLPLRDIGNSMLRTPSLPTEGGEGGAATPDQDADTRGSKLFERWIGQLD